MQKRRQPEVIAGRVNADGSIAAGDGFTTSGSAGAWIVTFPAGFRLITATATIGQGTSTLAVLIDTWTANSFRLFSYTIGGGQTGGVVSFIAVGVQQ